MTGQRCLDRLNRDFLAAIAGPADCQCAANLVAQSQIISIEGDATVEKGLAERTHVAEIDGGADDDASDPRVREFRDERGEIVFSPRFEGNPGGQVAVDLEAGQLDQLGFDSFVDRFCCLQTDLQRRSGCLSRAGTARDGDDLEFIAFLRSYRSLGGHVRARYRCHRGTGGQRASDKISAVERLHRFSPSSPSEVSANRP